jgi:hypothetical protein
MSEEPMHSHQKPGYLVIRCLARVHLQCRPLSAVGRVRCGCRQLVRAACAVYLHRRWSGTPCICGLAAGLGATTKGGTRLGLRLRGARQLPCGRRQAGVVRRQAQPVRLAELRQRLRISLLCQRRQDLWAKRAGADAIISRSSLTTNVTVKGGTLSVGLQQCCMTRSSAVQRHQLAEKLHHGRRLTSWEGGCTKENAARAWMAVSTSSASTVPLASPARSLYACKWPRQHFMRQELCHTSQYRLRCMQPPARVVEYSSRHVSLCDLAPYAANKAQSV